MAHHHIAYYDEKSNAGTLVAALKQSDVAQVFAPASVYNHVITHVTKIKVSFFFSISCMGAF
jgi:hypothetical protein